MSFQSAFPSYTLSLSPLQLHVFLKKITHYIQLEYTHEGSSIRILQTPPKGAILPLPATINCEYLLLRDGAGDHFPPFVLEFFRSCAGNHSSCESVSVTVTPFPEVPSTPSQPLSLTWFPTYMWINIRMYFTHSFRIIGLKGYNNEKKVK